MPLTKKGSEIMSNMESQYGPEKGEEVFYASKNKGTIKGVDQSMAPNASQSVPNTPPPVPMGSLTATAPVGLTSGISRPIMTRGSDTPVGSPRDFARAAGAKR